MSEFLRCYATGDKKENNYLFPAKVIDVPRYSSACLTSSSLNETSLSNLLVSCRIAAC